MRRTARAHLRQPALAAFRVLNHLRRQPHRYILILSHMRSGSSLLLHLIMTSRAVSGCGERNTAYRNVEDLHVFAIKANLACPGRRLASLSADQVNHSHFLPDPQLLFHPDIIPIVLLRDPEKAIGSMVDVFNRIREFKLDEGIRHYRERIATLSNYLALLKGRKPVLVLTYDDLVNDSEATLSRIAEHVGLKQPLSPVYQTYGFTGTRGDPSQRIRSGEILSPREDHGIHIEARVLAELTKAYDDCRVADGIRV